MTDEEESKREFKEVSEAINDFTSVLNKHGLTYQVKMWDSGEGYSLLVNKVSIDFFLSGFIEFDINEDMIKEKEEEK